MGRIRLNPEERKKQILDTAFSLFTSKGYAETSTQDIANAVNISKSTFFYYFKTKEMLLHELVRHSLDLFIERVGFSTDKPFLVNFQNFINTYYEDNLDPKWMKITEESKYVYDNQFMEELAKTARTLHTALVKQGIDEGVLHIDPDDQELCIIGIQEIVVAAWKMLHQTLNHKARSIYLIPALERLLGLPSGTLY